MKFKIKKFQTSFKAPSKNWVNKNIKMVACTTKVETCGGLYVSASSWQDAPTGPPVI
jgi:hypothetical protein